MTDPDPIEEWRAAVGRVSAMVTDLETGDWDIRVPACPDWTVRDLLSHMIGLDADVLAGDEPDDHNAEWTQSQVDARQGRSGHELVEEWAAMVEPLTAWMTQHGSRPLGDVTIHEQDLRGALNYSGARDSGAVQLLRDRMVGRFGEAVQTLAPIALVGDDGWSWATRGEPQDAKVELRASTFDFFRALTSRRSESQLRSWVVRGDVGPYLKAFAGLGPLPDHPLEEPLSEPDDPEEA